MSHADNKTHGGKGIKAPTAAADKNYRDNFDAIDWSKGKEDSDVSAENNPKDENDKK